MMADEETPGFLVLYATRYALGRKSHSVSEVCDYLEENWDSIPSHTKRHVHEAIVRRIGKPLLNLGDPCDKKRWLRILELPLDDSHSQELNYPEI